MYSNVLYNQAHVDTARFYIGVIETAPNDGPEIRRFIRSVGFNYPISWCSAYISYCLSAPDPEPIFPNIRSALASRFITRQSIKASHVYLGIKTPPRGSLVIWRRGNTIYGHIGIVLFWNGKCGVTLEGNTSSGQAGSQADGDGVWIRNRCIEPGSYFRIVSFTKIVY